MKRTVIDPDVKAEGNDLERDAATVLGYILFEYSTLDMELGLFLVWSDKGRRLNQLSKKLSEANFSKRLKHLEKRAKSKYSNGPAADEYAIWLHDTHAIRSLRNQLFHGRKRGGPANLA